jgi:exopolysaccharide/PEP-CTERM locus tyrosine autokinase
MSIVERALQKAQTQRSQAEAPPQSMAPEVPLPFEESTVPARAVDEPATVGRAVARGTPVEIDINRLRSLGRLAPEALAHQTEEEFRRIKWPVLNSIFGREGASLAGNNVVLVTSAIPGEGKTFNALNLALSLAREPDLEILLADGDVAQPALSRDLGLADRPGLTDLIADPTLDATDVIHPTSIDRLYVIPAGSRRSNSPELLASARMTEVIEKLSSRVSPGVVLFDSPPILATNEAQVLSRYAGQVLMVVMADSTEQRVVTEALALLDRSKPVSAILNRVEPSIVSRYYSHYYYGYGEGARR